MRGFSLVELLVALLLLAVICAITLPPVTRIVDHWRTRGAASFIGARVALTRMRAVQRNANVGLRFAPAGAAYSMRAYADGNGNGVRAADIASGADPAIDGADRLDQLFPGVTFGFVPGARLIDGSDVGAGDDPIRLGAGNTLVFSPIGTATSGTLYLRGRGPWQYAVVILGATGRTRVLRFEPSSGSWTTP
jgi:prepilin-type N-terminal cleavage/methylation domain-containing protein